MRAILNLLIIVLALTSCVKESAESSIPGAAGSGKNEGVISFRLSTQSATTYVWGQYETDLRYLRVYLKYELNDGTKRCSRLFDSYVNDSPEFSHTLKYGGAPKDPKQGSTATLYFLGNGTEAVISGFKDPEAPTEAELDAARLTDPIYTINPKLNSQSEDALLLNGVFMNGLVATRKFDIKLTSGTINSSDDAQNSDIKDGVVTLKRPLARIYVEVEAQGDQPGDLSALMNYRITFGKVAGSASYWEPTPSTPNVDSPVGTYLIRGSRAGQFNNTEAVGYLYPANNVVVQITSPDRTQTIEKTIPKVEANKIYKITIKPLPVKTQQPRGGSGDILYYDEANDMLRVGKWGGTAESSERPVKDSNIVYFKFGSVVGVTRNLKVAFDGINTSYTSIGEVPFAENVTGLDSISGNAYHTLANVKAGKGDPCRLAGISRQAIRNCNTDDELYVLEGAGTDSVWRTASPRENIDFAAMPTKYYDSGIFDIPEYISTPTLFRDGVAYRSYYGGRSCAMFPCPGNREAEVGRSEIQTNPNGALPFCGYMYSVGIQNENTICQYWTSYFKSRAGTNEAIALYLGNSDLIQYGLAAGPGTPIRCVRHKK